MIIYCAGPIKGDKKYLSFYNKIIEHVSSLGHTALSELNAKFKSSFPLNDKQIYKRDIKWIDGSQVMIAEISGPSLGVGFEIAYAVFKKKIHVLALSNKEVSTISAMITGCNSDLLTVKAYADEEEMKKIIDSYLKKMAK